MRKPTFVALAVILGALAVLAGGLILRLSRVPGAAGVSVATSLPVPDLTGWPNEFITRVQAAVQGAVTARPEAFLRDLGRLYHANGFRAEAERVWRLLMQSESQEARWPYYLAALRESAGDLGENERMLATTLRLESDYAPAHLRFAEFCLKQGRHADAARHFERRLQLIPGDPYARLGLARIDLDGHRDVAATRLRLEALVRDHPNFPSALNLLAELSARAGDEVQAASLRRRGHAAGRFREADDPWLDELDQYCYDAYQLQVLGALRMQTGRIAESLPFYEKSVRLAPEDGPAHEALGDVYLQLHRWEDARRTLEAGIAASPGTEALYSRLAQVWRAQARPADAVAVLRRGIRTLPDVAELYSDLGVALEELERREEALEAYRTAVRLNPALTVPQLNLGLCLLALGRPGEARTSLLRVLELHPAHGKALLALTQVEIDAGDLSNAGEHARRLYALDSDQPGARELLGLWHVRCGAAEARAGRVAEAERIFRAGLVVAPNFGELHANLGVLRAREGRYAEAVEDFNRFVAAAPAEPKARLYLGQALLGAGRREEARRALEQSRDLARQSRDEETAAQCDSLLASLQDTEL